MTDYNQFIDLRLDALLLSMLKKGIVNEEEFKSYLDECIEKQYSFLSEEKKEQLLKKSKEFHNY
ncbi:hypothetical protein [Halalkalibacter alkalisediminis]|uniref:Uncharacterized protein n=1 Tax=Halalkalibacter alkalisediminis TaxID=935616 RepID=A0ABV6NLC0_9BACI|nr:hypothetical protein [Halalkalibacter alkalisediminis]